MHPARARGLREADQAVFREHLADAQRDPPDLLPLDPGSRVEVDAQLVWMVEVRPPHRPGVPVDHPEVHAPGQVRAVVDDQLPGAATAREGHRRRLEPLGCRVRDALLEEGLAGDPVHPALHHGRALAQVAHDGRFALEVVADQVLLREAQLGEEDLAGVRDPQLAPADLDWMLLARGRHAGSMSGMPRSGRPTCGRPDRFRAGPSSVRSATNGELGA